MKCFFVNSPGSANLQSLNLEMTFCISFMTALLPCTWNSTISSPVYVLGPGSHSTIPSSINSLVELFLFLMWRFRLKWLICKTRNYFLDWVRIPLSAIPDKPGPEDSA